MGHFVSCAYSRNASTIILFKMSDQMQQQAEVMERKLREIGGVLRDQQKEKDLIVSRVQEEYKQLEQLQNELKELS